MDKPRLLVVNGDHSTRSELLRALGARYEIAVAEDRDSALAVLMDAPSQVAIVEFGPSHLADPDTGLGLLKEILNLDPLMRVVVITEHQDQSSAVKAIDLGAFDYYFKPIDMRELEVILRRAVHLRALDGAGDGFGRASRVTMRENKSFEILGSSRQMLSLFSTVDRVARSDATLLISGESGTGKELVARVIHSKSSRCGAPFVPINCGAIPDTLIESELFGHEKGSFTGAHIQRKGRLESADGGTVFLDEINELSPPLQVKLLRFLQEREIERIGGRRRISLDVRIIAASNTDLKNAIAHGSFREDLYYRLAVIAISLPPLRDRGGDGIILARYFVERMSREPGRKPRRLSVAAEEAIRSYAWPGNVRELENKVKRAIIMAPGRVITPADLDLRWPPEEASVISLRQAREEVERKTLIAALQRHRGNITRAASEIGVSRPTVHALLGKYNLRAAQFRQG